MTTVVQAQILLIENTGAATGRKSGKLTVRVGNPTVTNMSPVCDVPPMKSQLLCPRPAKLKAVAPSTNEHYSINILVARTSKCVREPGPAKFRGKRRDMWQLAASWQC